MARTKKRPEPTTPPSVRLTAHPPERHRRGSSVILASGGCCCCCCCLHSLGSLLGGIIGSVKHLGPPPEPPRLDFPTPLRANPTETRITTTPFDTRITAKPADPELPPSFRRDNLEQEGPTMSVTALYWLLVIVLLFLSPFLIGSSPNTMTDWLLLVLFFLPGFQLGASLLSAIAAGLFYGDSKAALARVGVITLFSVLGTGIGIGMMFLLFAIMK